MGTIVDAFYICRIAILKDRRDDEKRMRYEKEFFFL